MAWQIISYTVNSLEKSHKWHVGLAIATIAIRGSYRMYWNSRRPVTPKQLVAITGCGSGLGYSLALHCHEQGARVVAGVLNKNGKGAHDLQEKGLKVLGLDITDDASIQNFNDELKKMLVDEKLEFRALVNNAGVMIFGEFEWQLPKQAKRQIEVNLLGTMSITRKLLPLLRQHNSRIINVTSHCALHPLPGVTIYGATKAALQAWSDALRIELKKYGVSVVSFIPGSFPTESNIFLQQSRHFDEMRAEMSDEARGFYGDYFERYAGYLKPLSVDNSLSRLDNPKLYQVFDAALLTRRPSALYKCEPWRYTYYHALFGITPLPLRDWLTEKFVAMPSWKSGDKR